MNDLERLKCAQRAIQQIGFEIPPLISNLSFSELFDFPPCTQSNEMQIRALEAINGPGVYVIEAPMGMGKTEAALWVAYKLLLAGKARGIYFALPTQATSNRVHLRMDAFVKRISSIPSRSRLIHGNSWLMRESSELDPVKTSGRGDEDARTGNDWFASSKRALLAPFGVGTVDQALMGVVAAKHFFVRRFALAEKVVILDEVHSYDLYTGTLIDRLVEVLKGLGCTIIILSATLTGRRREQLLPSQSGDDTGQKALPYPLISGSREGGEQIVMKAQAPPSTRVIVNYRSCDAAMLQAVQEATVGRVVLWICNTVGASQCQFGRILHEAKGRFKVGLLHSRFPFWRREELENEWMERLGKTGTTRCGCILVATQIVEQSVDLDADLLITELAPTDMLFQRLGRLWRHVRPEREGTPEMILLEESESLDHLRRLSGVAIRKALGDKAKVYSPYVLLRSLEVWKSAPEVRIPDQIRERIEATYEERIEGEEPAPWQKLFEEMYGKGLTHRQKALQSSNIWSVALEDEEGVQTRLDELPTLPLILCQNVDSYRYTFLDGSTAVSRPDSFHLDLAQKIYKNLVRIPLHYFDTPKGCEAFESYLHGVHAVGLVDGEAIQVDGLKEGMRLSWSLEKGVVIEKASSRSQA